MSYLLPSYFLVFKEENLDELRSDLWNDDPVVADLVLDGVTYDIDIAYRGSYTRSFRKRSYIIKFVNPTTFEGNNIIHLNAEYKDPSLFRNKLSFDFFQDIGVLSPESQHVNLIRNDTLKGVYLQLESVDEYFLEKRGLPPGPIYYAVNNDANFSLLRDERMKKSLIAGYQQAVGDESDDTLLLDFIKKVNTIPLADFHNEIPQFLNIDTFLRWLAGAVCTMNNDGFTHNYALYRNSNTGLFEFIPWDYDATWGRKVDGGTMEYDYVHIEGKKCNHLCYLLMRVPEFRKRYRMILGDILENKFTVNYMENKVMSLYKALRPHVLLDPYKKRKIDLFDEEPEFIFQYIRDRNNYLKKQLVNFD